MNNSTLKNTTILNVGPQHPSTHGVLRLKCELNGERIIKIEPIIGYLHRGMEKMAETGSYLQYLPVVDRIDYLSGFFCSFAYLDAIEKLMDIVCPLKALYIRTITMELNRISSHLLWLGCYLMDLGATSPFFYAFIEREKILHIFEKLAGARMMYNYYTLGGVKNDINKELLGEIKVFAGNFNKQLKELEDLINNNPIFISRTAMIGVLEQETAVNYSVTGANLRASGILKDLRKDFPYLIYKQIEFDIPYKKSGDSYSRYIVRVKEMKESCKIVNQCLDWLYSNIEDLKINLKINTAKIKPEGEAIGQVESPRGLMLCYICADGTNKPFRIKWRTPSFYSVQLINEIAKNYLVSDLMSIFGSLDVIMPEVDR